MNIADIRQQSTMNYLVRGHDVIFNLAGQVSHIDSMQDPYTDLEINCRSQLTLLEACRHNNPAVKVVFAGTRQVYGRPDSLPVTESHLVRPTDINGINKAAGEYYHLVYNNVFGVRACSLRLTNVYGPRQLLKHNRQGFIAWFIRLVVENARSRSTATARSCAISSTWTMRSMRFCVRAPTMRQRTGVQRRRPRADLAPRSRGAADLTPPAPAGTASSSGRRKRKRSTSAISTPTRRTVGARSAGAPTTPLADGLEAHDRVLPRALRQYVPTSGATVVAL